MMNVWHIVCFYVQKTHICHKISFLCVEINFKKVLLDVQSAPLKDVRLQFQGRVATLLGNHVRHSFHWQITNL